MDLPEVKPRPDGFVPAADADVLEMIKGLEPGWYMTGDLYPRYVAWAKQVGKSPASAKSLGMALARVAAESRYVRGHLRVFRLEPAA